MLRYVSVSNIIRSIDMKSAKEYNHIYEDGKVVRATEYDIVMNEDELVIGKRGCRRVINMKKYKFGWRYWVFLIFFFAVVIFGGRVVVMLFNNEVTFYDGEMSYAFSFILGLLISLVLLTYLISVIVLFKQLIQHHGCGLTITYLGIENTLVFVNLLAFLIVVPVKCIPWEAITYFDQEDNEPYIRVNVRQIQAGWMAKVILFILGYHFCYGFVKPNVTREDVQQYF